MPGAVPPRVPPARRSAGQQPGSAEKCRQVTEAFRTSLDWLMGFVLGAGSMFLCWVYSRGDKVRRDGTVAFGGLSLSLCVCVHDGSLPCVCVCVCVSVTRSLVCCGTGWRSWCPGQAAAAPQGPPTPAPRPALERGSGLAVSLTPTRSVHTHAHTPTPQTRQLSWPSLTIHLPGDGRSCYI